MSGNLEEHYRIKQPITVFYVKGPKTTSNADRWLKIYDHYLEIYKEIPHKKSGKQIDHLIHLEDLEKISLDDNNSLSLYKSSTSSTWHLSNKSKDRTITIQPRNINLDSVSTCNNTSNSTGNTGSNTHPNATFPKITYPILTNIQIILEFALIYRDIYDSNWYFQFFHKLEISPNFTINHIPWDVYEIYQHFQRVTSFPENADRNIDTFTLLKTKNEPASSGFTEGNYENNDNNKNYHHKTSSSHNSNQIVPSGIYNQVGEIGRHIINYIVVNYPHARKHPCGNISNQYNFYKVKFLMRELKNLKPESVDLIKSHRKLMSMDNWILDTIYPASNPPKDIVYFS